MNVKPKNLSTALATLTAVMILSSQPLFADPLRGLADGRSASPQARRGGRDASGVYKATIRPHWCNDGARFWYRNDLRHGRREFLLVDAAAGTRGPAFDHTRLAAALQAAGVSASDADRLPVDDLDFEPAAAAVSFSAGGKRWRCDLGTYALDPIEGGEVRQGEQLTPRSPVDSPRASSRTGAETSVLFINRTDGEVQLFWRDTAGRRQSYGSLPPGAERDQHTYAGHVWEVVDAEGTPLTSFSADEVPSRAEITGRVRKTEVDRAPARRPRDESPDGRWTAFVRDDDVFVRSNADGQERALSQDGNPRGRYERLEWAPDARTLIAFRVEPGDDGEVYLVESSPDGGGRARLHQRPYPLPGDRFPTCELNLFDVEQGTQSKPQLDRIDFGRPSLRWNRDGQRFTYEQVDRGHQRFRLIEVDSRTGASRNLIDERSETFIWTEHAESIGLDRVHWLAETDEILYASEQDGAWQLYLVDAKTGDPPRPITQGDCVVRRIDWIDEQRREIGFRASGRHPDQDPYFVHHYRVRFDGSGLVALTEGNGDHSIQYSPDRQYLIDTYSRVDQPPIHELRRVADGGLVCELERADIAELIESGWRAPEVLVAKARDGSTGIWGVLYAPRDLQPEQKYPVLEDIYAGPQSAYVPKRFSAETRYASLTELGFAVVKIDGMGTAHRSKAFHDVCWKNLKDAGLPDRILWIQAAAETHPYLDLDRVGIYGVSAGGQNAAGAVLFHPEFYKAAAAFCGCHDNRLDKASWNEQWMGYPVGPQYAECSNVDNAHRLRGQLLLVVGEMDTNVPPESTLRFADALIKAGKDFELLVIPGAGHGDGGTYGRRRMQDFFVRHLQGETPPNRNE